MDRMDKIKLAYNIVAGLWAGALLFSLWNADRSVNGYYLGRLNMGIPMICADINNMPDDYFYMSKTMSLEDAINLIKKLNEAVR